MESNTTLKFIILGLAVGIIIGLVTDKLVLWLPMGMAIGYMVGVAKKQHDKDQQKRQ